MQRVGTKPFGFPHHGLPSQEKFTAQWISNFYIGNLNASYKGWFKAELLNKQQVLMQLPVVSSSFTEANKFSIHQLSSNIVPAVQTSYAISASNMVANKNIQFFNIVVDFSHTGEQLTNTVL